MDIEKAEELKSSLETLLRMNTSNSLAAIVDGIMRLTNETEIRSFDEKKYLLGFNNGVYDLHKSLFRPYEYSDFMTFSTGYNYKDIDVTCGEDKVMYDTLLMVLNQIMPDKERLDFLLRICSSCLDGYNSAFCFFFNGVGGNGKGSISYLNEYTLGGYFKISPNVTLESLDNKGGAANENVYGLNMKRCVKFEEPDTINESVLKKITGTTKIDARPLYGSTRSISLDSNMILEYNDDPNIGRIDIAVKRRLIKVKFISKFLGAYELEEAKTNGEENVYPRDGEFTGDEFGKKFKFVWLKILLDYYKKKKNKHGKIDFEEIPDIVRKETNDYIEGEDFIALAFNNLFEKIPSAEISSKPILIPFKQVLDSLKNDTDFRQKNVKRSVMKQWVLDKYTKMSIVIHNKTDHLVNFRWKIYNADVEEDDTEKAEKTAAGASMADAEKSITMTDIKGKKHTLERKAPK